jgi:hypothetical protein
MKRLILLLALSAAALIRAAIQPIGDVTLFFDYPTNQLSTNLTFRVYATTNLSFPLTNWTVIKTVVGTNTSVTVRVVPGQNYFAMTASNMWLESDFSNVALTPPLPRSDVNLTIQGVR